MNKTLSLLCFLFFTFQRTSQSQICQGDARRRRDLWGIITNFFNPTEPPAELGPLCRADWMRLLPNSSTHLAIGRLVIPGTHNAFCTEQDFTEESDLGMDLEVNILSSLDIPRSALTANKDILMKWSVTQSLSATQQLEIGVRFFDLRVAKHKTSGTIHIVHGLMGKKLSVHLTEIKTFLEAHPKEIVFLYFQKYYNMDTSDGLTMSRQINEIVGPKICEPVDFGHAPATRSTLSLQKIWNNGCQVILITHMDAIINEYIRFFQLPAFYWENFLDYDGSWSDTNSVRRMTQHAKDRKRSKNQVWKEGKMYALQAVLTPNALDIVFRKGLKEMTTGANEAFADWLEEDDDEGVNIVVADFIEMEDLISSIIDKNHRFALARQ